MTADELREYARVLRCRVKFIGDDDTGAAQMERDALLEGAALLEREASRLETQHTHSAECWKSGKTHYECAVREIERLRVLADEHALFESDIASACEWPEDETFVARIRRWKRERDALIAFAKFVLDEVNVDVQDEAVRLGLLVPVTVTEPCGENCNCAEWDEFPMTCFRKAPFLAGTIQGEPWGGEGYTFDNVVRNYCKLEAERDLLADEVGRCWSNDTDVLSGERPAAVTAILAARKEKRDVT